MCEEFGITVNIEAYFCSSTFTYNHGEIKLLAYIVEWIAGPLIPNVHDEIRWVVPEELGNFDFAPADIPIAKKLMKMLMLK